MANEVLIAHTGQRLQVDFTQLTSLDDFRSIVTRQTSIPPDCIIALTPQGKPLRLAAFQIETEIYVYDARTTQADAAGSAVTGHLEIPLPKRYTVSNPPNDLRDQRSLDAWQELFHTRQKWAATVAADCTSKASSAQERYAEMDAMMRCLDAAVANLEAVVKGVETKYTDIKKWIGNAQADYSDLVDRWEQYLELARNIPIKPAMLQFMTSQNGGASAKGKATATRPQQHTTLEDLIDLETAQKAGKLAPAALRRFSAKIAELDGSASQLFQGCEDVLRGFERAVERSALSHEGESAQLLQDINAVANKIDTDYQTTLGYSDSTRDVLQASKLAATHTERLLPSIKNRALEMDEMFRYATQARNALAVESINYMRSITELTSLSSDVKGQIAAFSEEEDMAHFDYLRLVQQIPFVYASFVSEAVKRREWLDKAKTDASTLANEMALFHGEEAKRRKKWQKSVGNLEYGPPSTAAEHRVAGLEVNLVGEEAEWPHVVRKDLEDFYDTLQRQKADAELIEDIGKMIADLNSPTRQQSKRVKAFKNGSIHEAALGRSGLLIRGDDDALRSLQEDKTRLENKLKTAESRVRRLEDLLHRQSQSSRASLGGVFQTTPSQQLSERTESVGSVAPKPGGNTPRIGHDRRTSLDGGVAATAAATTAAAAAGNEQRMAQRIKQLEVELASEKERSSAFEKDLQTRTLEKTEVLSRMDEANSTKKDLLENLEALKREFTEERKSLESEIKRLQARLEDTEDEMEHFGESRENEKASYDEKVQSLQAEMERLAKEYRDDTLKSQGQVEFLRKETKLQREQNESLDKQLQSAQEEMQATAKQMQEARDAAEAHIQGFRDLHDQLVSGDNYGKNKSTPPADTGDLMEAVTSKLADALSRLQTTAGDMVVVKADLERAEAANKELRDAVTVSKDTLAGEEMAARRLREKLAEGDARVSALEEELAECRGDLHELRTKIADGETGSETLRKRLEEEESRVGALTDEMAAKQSHLGSLEEELRLFQERHREAQSALSALSTRFDARTLQTKELSQRLYTQNDRLCRLLERLGFSITRDDNNAMVIQKVPRSERSSTSGGEGASSLLKRSALGLLPPARASDVSSTAAAETDRTGDVELLYWMNSADAETEASKYAAYMAAVGNFDIDALAETVYRRVKEVEHVARKLQRDLRSYREKAHSLQKEAHDKIAFKHFKEGDLALFLPTRNQTNGAWAAFNIGFPHYFLREQEAHRLQNREWLVARITRVQEKVVDLSKGLQQPPAPPPSQRQQQHHPEHQAGETSSLQTEDNENDNPFDLSDGLRWYLLDAQEDKPGAPSTPGLGKSTVAANTVEAVADIHTHARTASGRSLGLGLVVGNRPTGIDGVSKTLSRSLESRRSSTSSRKAAPFAHLGGAASGAAAALRGNAVASETNSLRATATDSPEQAASPPAALPATGGSSNNTNAATAAASEASTPPARPTPATAARNAPGTPQKNSGSPLAENARHSSEHPVAKLQREQSAASTESTSKRSIVWDSLWAMDYSYESGKKTK
ncbi:Autophagy-related protein 11 [Niveomyces insectorum RCEF 264]|uniref:Autophagy-related protein 11 n=1 Tax=Niveomyces insectorum RCEF 264 TaxID=1081102 RepID=A0A167M155_9HYPO|nr:Autophagy-related protein 11 [Niveomyces insectorum RCEF 264]